MLWGISYDLPTIHVCHGERYWIGCWHHVGSFMQIVWSSPRHVMVNRMQQTGPWFVDLVVTKTPRHDTSWGCMPWYWNWPITSLPHDVTSSVLSSMSQADSTGCSYCSGNFMSSADCTGSSDCSGPSITVECTDCSDCGGNFCISSCSGTSVSSADYWLFWLLWHRLTALAVLIVVALLSPSVASCLLLGMTVTWYLHVIRLYWLLWQ